MARRLALITGASSGIGAAFARVYASHGYDLAVTARRADRLAVLADELRLRHGVEVLALPADLADAAAPGALLAEIGAHGRAIDALVNNAGYGAPGPFTGPSWDDQRALLQVMLLAVADLTHAVVPGMVERRFGRIVNVASLAGLVPGGGGTAIYGAVKAFLVSLSQGLHAELRGAGVHVSALCPGFTWSEFHEVNDTRALTEGAPAWLWLGADEVAAAGYEAAEANRPVCVPGAPNKAIAAVAKLLPDEWGMALMAHGPGARRQL